MTMSRERWQRIDDLFAAALEIEAASRDAWLERECAGDDDLLAHVRRLLRRTSEAEAVLGDSVTGYASDILESLGGDALAKHRQPVAHGKRDRLQPVCEERALPCRLGCRG